MADPSFLRQAQTGGADMAARSKPRVRGSFGLAADEVIILLFLQDGRKARVEGRGRDPFEYDALGPAALT